MSQLSASARGAEQQARAAVRQAAPWVQRLARLGYAAKGVVYIIIGVIAADAAFSPAERVADTRGALGTILHQSYGKVLLGIVALGLAGYVLWQVVRALLDPEHKGGGLKGTASRVGYGISALLYSGLTLTAVRMLRGMGGGGNGDGAQHWTATVMQQPFGRVLVGLGGAGIAAFGIYEIVRAFRTDLTRRLNLEGSEVATRRRVVGLGRAGMSARGVVFGIIGWLVILAAVRFDPSRAEGLAGALVTLRQAPAGPYVMAAVALGLVAYGVFQLVNARFRVIRAG